MIWGGGSGKSGKKKTQRLLAWEKKNSTQQPGRKKKLNCRLARKKKLNKNSLPEAPPQIINGPSLMLFS